MNRDEKNATATMSTYFYIAKYMINISRVASVVLPQWSYSPLSRKLVYTFATVLYANDAVTICMKHGLLAQVQFEFTAVSHYTGISILGLTPYPVQN